MPLPTPVGKQREVVTLVPRGHVVVLGTAGSGKTTMAIHRAAYLSDRRADHAGRTLLVTFNNALVTYLEHLRPPALREVDVRTFHRFARGYLASRGLLGRTGGICPPSRRRDFISAAVASAIAASPGEPLFRRPVDFFVDEVDWLSRHGIDSQDDYVRRERIGRAGARLPREQRRAMYGILEEYRRLRASAGYLYDLDDIASATRQAFEGDASQRLYKHVVIDEGQDFSPEMVRALALAIPDDGSLTLFGDVAQQIYGRRLAWSDAGLDIREPWKFERNYRNSPQIAALGLAIAAMPYYFGEPDMIAPTEFAAAGPLPTGVAFDDEEKETAFVIDQARGAAETGTVAILTRRNSDLRPFVQAFPQGQRLHRDLASWNSEPGVSYGTVHSAKGLEFDTVIIPRLSAEHWPDPVVVQAEGAEEAAAVDGRVLYVAITRARQGLIFTHTGAPSTLLPRNAGLWIEVRR